MDMINIKTKYINEPAHVQLLYYSNGRHVIQLFNTGGELLATATVNVPKAILHSDEVLIKNWSENEGILEALIENKIVEDTGRIVSTGFVEANICRLLPKDSWGK